MQVEKCVHLYRRLGGPEVSPRKHRHAEIDGGRIQRIDAVGKVKAEVFVCIQLPCLCYQTLSEVSPDPPVPGLVGIGKCRTADGVPKPHMVEFRGLCRKADCNVSQAFTVSKLSEGHGFELFLATEALDPSITAKTFNSSTQCVHRQMIHQLCKHQLALVHEPPPVPGRLGCRLAKAGVGRPGSSSR